MPITVFVAFTRRWAVETWLENFANVNHDPALTNICLIVDCDEQYIVNLFKKFSEERGYRNFIHKMNPDWNPNETNLKIRRQRVADIKNQSKDLIALTDGELILGFEDDTIVSRMPDFSRLIDPFQNEEIGFVEGVQIGRWGARMVGAWRANNIASPSRIQTIVLPERLANPSYEEITGGGFYGYATRRDLYLNHDYYTSTSQPWGPDVNYGFYVRQKGYKCLIDWQTNFGHWDYNKVGWPEDFNLMEVIFEKDTRNGKWNRADHEHSRF